MSTGGPMTCSSCGGQTPAGKKFCIHCGAHVRQACPACGEPVIPGARFCAECGTTLARLVTVVGEAGSGKSRLLWEFFRCIDGIEEVRWWHQGRCLAYGEGVAYWAVAEMVRSRARIQEEEDPHSARQKLRETVEKFVSDERERRLVEPRLAHLAEAREICEQLGATRWLAQIDELSTVAA